MNYVHTRPQTGTFRRTDSSCCSIDSLLQFFISKTLVVKLEDHKARDNRSHTKQRYAPFLLPPLLIYLCISVRLSKRSLHQACMSHIHLENDARLWCPELYQWFLHNSLYGDGILALVLTRLCSCFQSSGKRAFSRADCRLIRQPGESRSPLSSQLRREELDSSGYYIHHHVKVPGETSILLTVLKLVLLVLLLVAVLVVLPARPVLALWQH
jgi:hypothetical protein